MHIRAFWFAISESLGFHIALILILTSTIKNRPQSWPFIQPAFHSSMAWNPSGSEEYYFSGEFHLGLKQRQLFYSRKWKLKEKWKEIGPGVGRLHYCSSWFTKNLSDPRQDPTPSNLCFLFLLKQEQDRISGPRRAGDPNSNILRFCSYTRKPRGVESPGRDFLIHGRVIRPSKL